MRILMLTQWYVPEPNKLVAELAESLQALGHKVTVLTTFPNYPSGRIYPGYRMRLCQTELINGVLVIRIPVYVSHDRSAIRRSLNYLSFALSAAVLGPWLAPRYDVVYTVQPITAAVPAWILSRLRRVPFVFEIQDMWPETLPATGMVDNPRILNLIDSFAKWAYRKAAGIRVISPGFRENLLQKGVPAEKIHVVSNWVDVEHFRPTEPDQSLAQELGLAGHFNVMYAGNIGLAQGMDTVLGAAALLTDLSDVRFVLVGDGADFARIRQLARDQGLTNVTFLGRYPFEMMPKLYSLAGCLLVHLRRVPLFRITIPHKIFEYMASGRPIVAAIEGDGTRVVEQARVGIVCPPDDPDAMAAAVRRLYTLSENELRVLAENGRRAACEVFRRENAAQHIADVLAEVANSSKASLPENEPRANRVATRATA